VDVETIDAVVVGCLLLLLAWTGILMWRTLKPPRYLFVIAAVPAMVASALVVMQMAIDAGGTVAVTTIYLSVAAVFVPFTIMVRHQIVRLIEFVFPTARLVRRGRRSG
jgi:hypothetical protein